MSPAVLDDVVEEPPPGISTSEPDMCTKMDYHISMEGGGSDVSDYMPDIRAVKPARRVSLNREMKKLIPFAFIVLSFWGGLSYFMLREPKNPNAITTGQYIEIMKKSRESTKEAYGEMAKQLNSFVNSIGFYKGVKKFKPEVIKGGIDPHLKHTPYKFLNPGEERFEGIKSEEYR